MSRLVLACLIALLAAGAASARADAPILSTAGHIHAFAADGWRIARPSAIGPRWCENAEIIDARTRRRSVTATTSGMCDGNWAGTGPWEIAIASDRVAWIAHGATNNSSALVLSTARIEARRGIVVASGDGPTFSGDEVEYPDRRLGLLGGDGATLAFATWTIAPGGRVVRDERVWRIGPTGAMLPVGRVPGLTSVAVQHGTIAALDRNGAVTLVNARNRTRRSVVLQGLGTRAQRRLDFDLGLSKGKLVVLTSRSLEVFDAASGALSRAWPLPPVEGRSRGLVDVEGDWITFLVRNRIHVHRISDGAAGVLPPERLQPRGCDGDVWAQVEPLGLIFSSAGTDARGCRRSRLDSIGFDELASFVGSGG